MVRRKKPKNAKPKKTTNENENIKFSKESSPDLAYDPGKSDDIWAIPSMDGQIMKPTMITTYSKKRPLRVTPSRKPHFLTLDDPYTASRKTLGMDMEKQNTQLKGKRKHPPDKDSNRPRKSPKVSHKKPNKTTVSIGSMVMCTMRDDDMLNDDVFTAKQMSMCSVVDGDTDKHTVPITHNSTVNTANGFGTIADYVPGDISMINGDLNQLNIVSSFCNEQTPPVQKVISAAKSTKRVQFSVNRNNKLVKSSKPNARRSILKTPGKSLDSRETMPKSSGPKTKSNVGKSDTMVYNSYESQETCKNDSGETTEKLLEFEPLPLECSDDNISSHRDITPETSLLPASSGKERRRLSFLPHRTDPVCILLDFPLSKPKSAKVLIGESLQKFSIKEIHSLPTDILICEKAIYNC